MKWALRGLIGFLTLSVILTGTVQIPYVQTRIVQYATEMVTESLGIEMEIGAVDLHLFQRTLTLSDLTCSTGGAEILCGTLDLKYKGASTDGISEFGEIRLDGVRFFADSMDQIYDAFLTDSSAEYSIHKMFFERFEINDFEWQIGDSLKGHIALFALDSIFIESDEEMSEGGTAVDIGGYIIRSASTDFNGTNLISVETSHGKATFKNNGFDLTVADFTAAGIEFQGSIESANMSELGGPPTGNPLPDFDVTAIVHPSFLAPWVNDEVKGILEALETDALTGDLVCKNGELVIHKLSNSDVTVSGSVRNVGEDIVWDLNADLNTSVLDPWTEDLKGVMQEKSPQVKKIADKIKSIQLSASGSTNNIEGTVAVSQDVEGGLFLEVDYTMNWKENGFAAGWESTFHLDSLNTEYGILENLHVQIIGEEGHVEVNWDNDILKARALEVVGNCSPV